MPNLSLAMTIPGFMSEAELYWLATEAQRHRLIVEIGSYYGRSTRALADNTHGVVWALDDFFGPRDVEMRMSERQELEDRFMSNLGDHVVTGKVRVYKALHEDPPPDLAPDMTFIDGSHRYEDVKRDLQWWLPRTTHLLCGHDIDHSQVREALTEVLGSWHEAPGTAIWYHEKVVT